MKTDKYLVVGASGQVGSELVKLLRAEGYSVRSTTSKLVKDSDQLVHLDQATGEGVRSALEGIDRAFFISPPGYSDQHATLSPLIQEAKRQGIKKVVLMTAMGANAADTPFRRAEIELEKSGLNYNIIRPNWFYQNFNTFWIQSIKDQNKVQLPAGTAKVSFIDSRDISAVAFELLTKDQFNNQDFDLTGPESVTHSQVADAISAVSGKNIKYEDIKPEVLHAGLLKAGLPKGYADFLIVIFGFLREGYSAGLNDNVRKITGKAPRGLKNYSNDYKQNWL